MATATAEQTQKSEAKPGDPLYTLLVKLGVNPAGAAKLGPQEAHNKIVFRVTKQGIPADLTADEKAIVIGLGFSEDGKPPAKPEPDKAVPYRLPGIPGQSEDRVEAITATMAKHRNARRSDGRKWEPAPEGTPLTEAVAKTPNKTTTTTSKETKTAETTAGKGDETVATAMKNKKTAKAKGRATATAKATAKTDPDKGGKTVKKERKAREPSGGALAFRKLFETKKPVAKEEAIAIIAKAGCTRGASYISYAKRPLSGNGAPNIWGFLIKETVTKDGVKMLQRV